LNWKLIFLLSGFGLVMGIATVFLIPSKIEPMFWLAIFIVCAYFISKQTEKPFSHGLFVGLANSVWITASHILFFNQYIANHPREAEMMSSMPLPDSPRVMMALIGPVVGLVSGVVIGLFALAARKLLKHPGRDSV
jgi:hypothetical protein